MRLLTLLFFVGIFQKSSAQVDTLKFLIGTWDVCIDLNYLDTSCREPFNFFELRKNGEYYEGEKSCGQMKVPILGKWRFENSNLHLLGIKGPCFKNPDHGYSRVKFINDNLMYSISISGVGENDGKPIYFIFKRRR